MKKLLFFLITIFIFGTATTVYATESNQEAGTVGNNTMDQLEEFDFTEIQQFLDQNVESKDINFLDTAKRFISGESDSVIQEMLQDVKEKFFAEFTYNKESIGKVIIIAVISAFFTNFAAIFAGNNISETGFYITYMLLITVLISAFTVITSVAVNMITLLLEFMQALIPTYFLAVGLGGGTTSALAFYQITLVMITAVNWLFLKLIIPAVNIYVILILVNSITKEDLLSKFAELIETIVKWLSKSALGVVLGVNVIQGMVLPSVDAVKSTAFGKIVSIIPGIGAGAGGVTEILMGTGRIIKNGIGVAALVVIIVICLIPIIKLAVFSLMYQAAGAFIQPVTDRRVSNCVSAISKGTKMLLSCVLTTAFLFAITIAIICVSTNISI